MPNMLDDGFLDQAYFVNHVATTSANADYQLQSAVSNAIATAAVGGALTVNANVAAYSNTLVQLLMKRLTDMGYTSSLSGTTLTVNWN